MAADFGIHGRPGDIIFDFPQGKTVIKINVDHRPDQNYPAQRAEVEKQNYDNDADLQGGLAHVLEKRCRPNLQRCGYSG